MEKLGKAYLLHRYSGYDLQGKEVLRIREKSYLADTALQHSALNYNTGSVASSPENIVYLELCHRRYTIGVRETDDGEINFAAVWQDRRIYVQVT